MFGVSAVIIILASDRRHVRVCVYVCICVRMWKSKKVRKLESVGDCCRQILLVGRNVA